MLGTEETSTNYLQNKTWSDFGILLLRHYSVSLNGSVIAFLPK